MKNLILLLTLTFLCGCAEFAKSDFATVAASPTGSAVIAKTVDDVIHKGLDATATGIDTGNPYLHSVADALRANPQAIVNPTDVQKLFVDYGDPNNKSKFKTLALDLWNVTKNAAIQYGSAKASELLASGLQIGASK